MTKRVTRELYLGPMPPGLAMRTVDERIVRAPVARIFGLASEVEKWPAYLQHYRYVRFRTRRPDGGGRVEMSAYRPFQAPGSSMRWLCVNWPTWWLSEMAVDTEAPAIRFRHIGGITRGMEVEWTFTRSPAGTCVRIVHVWDGPRVPWLGTLAATQLIGPIFVHGIASRTLAGLAAAAERGGGDRSGGDENQPQF